MHYKQTLLELSDDEKGPFVDDLRDALREFLNTKDHDNPTWQSKIVTHFFKVDKNTDTALKANKLQLGIMWHRFAPPYDTPLDSVDAICGFLRHVGYGGKVDDAFASFATPKSLP